MNDEKCQHKTVDDYCMLDSHGCNSKPDACVKFRIAERNRIRTDDIPIKGIPIGGNKLDEGAW